MKELPETRNRSTLILRWTARAWSIAAIGTILLLIAGEGFDPAQTPPSYWLGFLFFPLGISIGMILAWRREALGGVVTVASLVVFYSIHLATTGTLPKGRAWPVLAAPGFLFLLSWRLSRKPQA